MKRAQLSTAHKNRSLTPRPQTRELAGRPLSGLDGRPAVAQFRQLKRYPPDDRRFLIAEARSFQGAALGEWLRQESLRRAGEDPAEAAELAELGQLIAQRDPERRA